MIWAISLQLILNPEPKPEIFKAEEVKPYSYQEEEIIPSYKRGIDENRSDYTAGATFYEYQKVIFQNKIFTKLFFSKFKNFRKFLYFFYREGTIRTVSKPYRWNK